MSESADPAGQAGQDAAETPTEMPGLPQVRDKAHNAPEAAQVLSPPDRDLEDLLRRRAPRRLRIAQGLLLLLAIAAVTGLLIRGVSTTPGRAQVGVATATPVPLGPVLLLSNVSPGTVTLNGTPLAGSLPLVATFRRGLNTLTLSAPPFHPWTCHVRWPGGQLEGGCALYTDIRPGAGAHYQVAGREVSPALIVELSFSLGDLPSAVQTQALAAATTALHRVSPQTRVPAGEYIATGQDARGAIMSKRTAAPLEATLLAAATTFRYETWDDDFCGDLACAPGISLGAVASATRGGGLEWVLTAGVMLHWQFSAGGGVVADSAPWSALLPTMLLTYAAQTGWTLDQRGTERVAGYGLPLALAQTVCTVEISMLSDAAEQHGDTLLTTQYGDPLQGCTFALKTAQGANAGRFLWRFGVLLAADGPAHTLLPSLPLAPAGALAAVGG